MTGIIITKWGNIEVYYMIKDYMNTKVIGLEIIEKATEESIKIENKNWGLTNEQWENVWYYQKIGITAGIILGMIIIIMVNVKVGSPPLEIPLNEGPAIRLGEEIGLIDKMVDYMMDEREEVLAAETEIEALTKGATAIVTVTLVGILSVTVVAVSLGIVIGATVAGTTVAAVGIATIAEIVTAG